MTKYGFVYIWYDSKRKMYYIGSHWGHTEDRYICSSNRMRNAYRRRPNDFKRKIIKKIYSNRTDLLIEENIWLNLAKKRKERYYNIEFSVFFEKNHISYMKGKTHKDSSKKLMSKNNVGMKGKFHSEETKLKMSLSAKKEKPWLRNKKRPVDVINKIIEANKGQKRVFKSDSKTYLKEENRTEKQKQAALMHSIRMKNRIPWNKK